MRDLSCRSNVIPTYLACIEIDTNAVNGINRHIYRICINNYIIILVNVKKMSIKHSFVSPNLDLIISSNLPNTISIDMEHESIQSLEPIHRISAGITSRTQRSESLAKCVHSITLQRPKATISCIEKTH